ncbi:TatD family hydrolase [Solimicrobium silvestre]|uniref:Mg-dependent DNase n=1 Tax=Solimicrobium silvestre TaxID=2099400 RepID=A0A2S9GZH3_9BURK|nr:TatD family hydrolase [Solimicrobium silvestre]PRC93135.1 Mg-dependent DNase [Solimicrobium silvestre]
MWIDTHCHLDAPEFNGTGAQVALRAKQRGVRSIVVPAVCRANFASVANLGQFGGYALGIHPIFVPKAEEADLQFLRTSVERAMSDPHFVAIGEIGLDFFVAELCTPEMREKQAYFYREQLRIAKDFGLPVLLHVRRSVDQILKYLRQIGVPGGIAHAFNGSQQQADMLIKLGFKLGFGGAMTYTRALQIRRLASTLPLSSIVLETDAPDIPPNWLEAGQNSPEQLPQIAEVLAQLRGISLDELASATCANASAVLPRLLALPPPS